MIMKLIFHFYPLEKSRPQKLFVHDHIEFNKIHRAFGGKLMTPKQDFNRNLTMHRQNEKRNA